MTLKQKTTPKHRFARQGEVNLSSHNLNTDHTQTELYLISASCLD
jgi:hypothetical protein